MADLIGLLKGVDLERPAHGERETRTRSREGSGRHQHLHQVVERQRRREVGFTLERAARPSQIRPVVSGRARWSLCREELEARGRALPPFVPVEACWVCRPGLWRGPSAEEAKLYRRIFGTKGGHDPVNLPEGPTGSKLAAADEGAVVLDLPGGRKGSIGF